MPAITRRSARPVARAAGRFSEIAIFKSGPTFVTIGPLMVGKTPVGAALVMTPLADVLGRLSQEVRADLSAYTVDGIPDRDDIGGRSSHGRRQRRPQPDRRRRHRLPHDSGSTREALGRLVIDHQAAAVLGVALHDNSACDAPHSRPLRQPRPARDGDPDRELLGALPTGADVRLRRLAPVVAALATLAGPAVAHGAPPVAHPNPVLVSATVDYVNPLPASTAGGVAQLPPLSQDVIKQAVRDQNYLAYQASGDLGGFLPARIGQLAVAGTGGHNVVGTASHQSQIPQFGQAAPARSSRSPSPVRRRPRRTTAPRRCPGSAPRRP